MADFADAVRQVIAGLPPGETFSYGWVADEAGYPGRARAVGALLAEDGEGLPWWRVVRSDGTFAEHLAREQSARLHDEGVTVSRGRVREGPHRAAARRRSEARAAPAVTRVGAAQPEPTEGDHRRTEPGERGGER